MSRNTLGAGLVGLGIGAVVSVILVAGGATDPPDVDPDRQEQRRYFQCTFEHDETQSRFTDAQWCDPERLDGAP